MLVLVFTTRVLLGLAEPKMKMADHNPRGVSKWIRVLFQYPRFRRYLIMHILSFCYIVIIEYVLQVLLTEIS